MFVLFAVVAALWGAVLVRQRAHAHRLHGLMAVLVVFKALTLLSQAGMFQLIRTTGHPEGWNVAFYVFNFLRGILFFTVRPPRRRARAAAARQRWGVGDGEHPFRPPADTLKALSAGWVVLTRPGEWACHRD